MRKIEKASLSSYTLCACFICPTSRINAPPFPSSNTSVPLRLNSDPHLHISFCFLELTGVRQLLFLCPGPVSISSQTLSIILPIPPPPLTFTLLLLSNTAVQCEPAFLPALVSASSFQPLDGHPQTTPFRSLWLTSWSCQANSSKLPFDCENMELCYKTWTFYCSKALY